MTLSKSGWMFNRLLTLGSRHDKHVNLSVREDEVTTIYYLDTTNAC